MNRLHALFAAVAVFVVCLFTPTFAKAGAGDLDSLDAMLDNGLFGAAVQPDGKILLAGVFHQVLGAPRQFLARLNADGTLDAGFDPHPDNAVFSVAVQGDGKILLAGSFTSLQPNGAATPTTRKNVARLNADGTLDESFDPSANNGVFGLAVQADGKILLAGQFTSLQPNGAAAPTPRNYVARLNADGTLDEAFDPHPDNIVANATVQPDGKILLGGAFTSLQPNGAAAPTPRKNMARVNADGTLDADFDPSPNSTVGAMVVQPDGKVLLSGVFTSLQPNGAAAATPRKNVARVNADGTLDAAFDPNPNDGALSLGLQADGKVLLAGQFNSLQPNGAASPTPRTSVARVNADGTLDDSFDPNPNATLFGAMVAADGKVLLAGSFSSLRPNGASSSTPRAGFARLLNDPVTQTLSATSTARVQWLRSGAAPELAQVAFEVSTDGGASWSPLGTAARIAGGWERTGLNLPPRGQLRARGQTRGGYLNGSTSLIEQVVVLDLVTETPTLTAPATNAATKSPVTVTFTLPEAALSGSVKLKFNSNFQTLTLASSQETAGTHTFSFDPADPVGTSGGAVASIPSGSIPDATYTVTLSYQDAAGNPAATATSTNVKIDTVTLSNNALGLPQENGTMGGPFGATYTALSFYLPEAAQPGSVVFIFKNETTSTEYALTTTSAVTSKDNNLIYIKFSDPVGGSYVSFPNAGKPAAFASMTNGSTIPDGGPYSVSFTYRDAVGNTAVKSNVVSGVTIDTVTQTPTLTVPVQNGIYKAPLSVSYNLPEAALEGTVQLKFIGSTTYTLTLTDAAAAAGLHNFQFDPRDPTAAADFIKTGPIIPDGTYTVQLVYRDAILNPAASVSKTSVKLDTKPPTFTPNFSPTIVYSGTKIGDYRWQAGASDENGLFIGGLAASQSPPVDTVLTEGIQQVTVSNVDNAGNTASVSFNLNVRPAKPKPDWMYRTGDVVPDAGAIGGPPSGAKATTFGVPAIDASGAVAYVGQWIGDDRKKGAGLFADDHCLAVVGADAAPTVGTTGAKWKSFTDPVIDAGKVVCIATLSGVSTSSATAVLSNAANGAALEVLARAGDVAPIGDGSQPNGGEIFKSFKGVAINGSSAAFLAQLATGVSSDKVTAANDLGLWMKDGTNQLRLVLREGQTLEIAPSDTRTIKTIVSFASGNGSPGQGRGWLAQPYGPAMLALLTFTDKSQAVVSAVGGGTALVLSRTAKTGGDGPEIPGSTFASYSIPATNDSYTTAFLASMTVGAGGVTQADARGVFVSNGSNGYTALARVGKPSGVNDADFSVLKDPVLAGGDGIAFLATLKGGSAKGLKANTLWWRPPGGTRGLLAQGGARPSTDLPEQAQWKAFTSLAIAKNRGPIFVATLVPGKGGVTAAAATGVWACDFLGAPRLLFRTDDEIDLGDHGKKKVKSFALLRTSVGSVGVTRSFSEAQHVVWLATFTDGSQAIMTSIVP